MARPAVELDNITVEYGRGRQRSYGLRELSASFPEGVITGLAGPDGAGKSTLLRLLAGLLTAGAGSMTIFGSKSRPDAIGYMPQKFGLYEDLSVRANMQLQATLRGVAGPMRDRLFAQLLEFTGLGRFQKRLAGNLSGGMKQKLGIACALLGSPQLLLLDEPGVGVDPQSRRELWSMAQELRKVGMTIIWATSYMDEAQKCAHIVILEKGRALWQGEPDRLMAGEEGRVFLLPQRDRGGDARRRALVKWSENPFIEDAFMEGSSVRLVLAENMPEATFTEIRSEGVPARPVLSDAYMALIGGINHAPSPFSAMHADRPAVQHGLPRIEARNLTKKFGDFTAASNVSFDVSSGEIFGLLGPNGAGKSTTFRMLCGLLRPTSGTCAVDGVNLLNSQSRARSRLGYMAQKFSLYPDISVARNISITADLYGMTRQRLALVAPGLISAFGLTDYLNTHAGDLPAGLKQRLSLLAATIHEPPVLFLDEPTSGVDIRARRDFWKNISALASAGAAVLVTTHFMEEAEYCDTIALMYRGEIIRQGSPDELKAEVKGRENPTLEDAFIASIEQYDELHPL